MTRFDTGMSGRPTAAYVGQRGGETPAHPSPNTEPTCEELLRTITDDPWEDLEDDLSAARGIIYGAGISLLIIAAALTWWRFA